MSNKVLEIVKISIAVVAFTCTILFCVYSDTHYERVGYIKNTDIPNIYTFTDSTGNIWEFANYDMIIPYNTAIEASARMYTNNTLSYIEDDMILDIDILSLSKNKK